MQTSYNNLFQIYSNTSKFENIHCNNSIIYLLSGMMHLLEFTFWETIFSLTLQIDRNNQF